MVNGVGLFRQIRGEPGTNIVGEGLSTQLYDPMHLGSLMATFPVDRGTVRVVTGSALKPSVISRFFFLLRFLLVVVEPRRPPRPRAREEDECVWGLSIEFRASMGRFYSFGKGKAIRESPSTHRAHPKRPSFLVPIMQSQMFTVAHRSTFLPFRNMTNYEIWLSK